MRENLERIEFIKGYMPKSQKEENVKNDVLQRCFDWLDQAYSSLADDYICKQITYFERALNVSTR